MHQVLRNYTKLDGFCSYSSQGQNVNFCVANWKAPTSLNLGIFQMSRQPRRMRKIENTKHFCWCRQGRWQKNFQGGGGNKKKTEKKQKRSKI